MCLLQLEKFDGRPSHSHKKDDFADSLSLLAFLLPMTHEEIKKEDPEEAERRKREAEEEYAREMRREYHDRMHGGTAFSGTRLKPRTSVDTSIAHSEWQRQQRGEPQFPEAPAPTPQH